MALGTAADPRNALAGERLATLYAVTGEKRQRRLEIMEKVLGFCAP